MKRKLKKVLLAVLCVLLGFCLLVAAGLVCLYFMFPVDEEARFRVEQERKLTEYAQTHEEFTLGEILEFEWDTAYNYPHGYGTGTPLKEKYGLEFEIPEANDEVRGQLIFFKDGEFVINLIYERFSFRLDNRVEVFTPETVFILKKERETKRLIPKNPDDVVWADP